MLVSRERDFLDLVPLALGDGVGNQLAAGSVFDIRRNLDIEVAFVLKVQLNAAAAFVDKIGVGRVSGIDWHPVPELALTDMLACGLDLYYRPGVDMEGHVGAVCAGVVLSRE